MNTRISVASRLGLALALVLTSAAMTESARADGAFGAYMDTQPIAAARTYWQSKDHTLLTQQPYATSTPRVVSTVPTVDGRADVVGNHGPQDDLARQIYQPGSRPMGW